jgi:membrane-associated phospholipid phosphatase
MHAIRQFSTDLSALGGLPVFLVMMVVMPHQALTMLAALAIAMGVVIPTRLIWRRSRPEKREAKNLIEQIDASSFPSIHTARAAILGLALVTAPWMYLITALIIGGVSYSRVTLKAHDLLDVGVGALLGIASWLTSGILVGMIL